MSLFSSLKPQGGQKLNAFDLSRRDIFSAKSGVLNVCFVQHTVPESKYEVSHAQITRVDPVQTAPFARMSENYEYFFVPYSQLFTDFERIYYGRGDFQRNPFNLDISSNPQISETYPTFDYYNAVFNLGRFYLCSRVLLKLKSLPKTYNYYLDYLRSQFEIDNLTHCYLPFDIHGEPCIDEMLKLFDNLGYGNLFAMLNSTIAPFFTFDYPEYQNGGYQVVGSQTIDLPSTYNRNLLISLLSTFNCYYSDAIPLDVDADYDPDSVQGDYAELCKFFYNNLCITISDSNDAVPNFENNDGFTGFVDDLVNYFINGYHSVYNGYHSFVQSFNSSAHGVNVFPSIFPLAAYNKIFADIYRNSQFDVDYNYSSFFNFDYVNSHQLSVIDEDKFLAMLIPHFRQYKKDLFTGVYPNAQFGATAVAGLNDGVVNIISRTSSQGNANTNAAGYLLNTPSASGVDIDNRWQLQSVNGSFGLSALAIRQALSLQRYRERILRAGNRITSLQNAVFGDRSRFLEKQYVEFIGAEKNNIDFNSVAATSDAGNSEVGQLGANGVGTHVGKAFEFHSHDFGLIIGIYYVLPESEYEAFMIDPMNTKSEPNDFYKPDFMNLSLSPVFNYNFNILGGFSLNIGRPDYVLGYLANYWEYKTSLDKVHGNFYCSTPYISGEDAVYDAKPNIPSAEAFTRGQNAYYVTPRSASAFRNQLTLANLYVNPHDIDSIFYVNSDFTLDTDQFKVNCNHDVKALLPMSVTGLPEY